MTPSQKPGVRFVSGIPISIPNTTYDGEGFYVSYNNRDGGIYGSDTTALVVGQMQSFYILNGDHRTGYGPLLAQGLGACLAYFRQNVAQMNKYSETPPID